MLDFYLRRVNPLVALLVLSTCLWAAISDEHKTDIASLYEGGIPTYFAAKGIFCCVAIFLLGKLVENTKNKQP